MVKLIKTWNDLIQARKNNDEDCIFDTAMVSDKAGGYTLQLDLKDIMSNVDNSNFTYYTLERTMESFKNKSQKFAFINTVLREIGKNMRVSSYDGEIKSIYGREASYGADNLKFLKALLQLGHEHDYEKWDKALDSDVQVIANLIDVLSRRKFNFNGMHFDSDNPMHNMLANVVKPLEKNGHERFKGFTERWNADTMSLYEKAELAKKNIKNNPKKTTLVHDLQNLSIKELYDAIKGKWSKMESKDRLYAVGLLIDRAPVNKEWYQNIFVLLPKFNKSLRGTLLQDTYQVLDAFDKKFRTFEQSAKNDFSSLQNVYNQAKSEFDASKKLYTDLQNRFDALKQKRDDSAKYEKSLNNIDSVFYEFISHNDLSTKEKEFYNVILDKLRAQIRDWYSGKRITEIHIEGRPWGMFATSNKKNRLAKASAIVEKYNNIVRDIKEKITREEYDELYKLSGKISDAKWDYDKNKRKLDEIQGDLEISRSLIGNMDAWNNTINDARQTRAQMFEDARRKIEQKVDSGYRKWSQDADVLRQQKEVEHFAKKIKSSNPNLSEEELLVLASRILSEKRRV